MDRELPRDVDERARVELRREAEQRSVATTAVIVVLAVLCALAREQTGAGRPVFDLAVLVIAPLALVRLGVLRFSERLPAGSRGRARLSFGSLLVLVAAWGGFVAWGGVVDTGTPLSTVLLTTQCLCSAAVVVSYAGTPRLAVAIIVLTIVPVAVALAVVGVGPDRASGVGSLVYCAMLATYVPRVGRERRSAVASILMLQERARSLEEARDAALSAASAKEAFFANLSHEIRTPLHGLLGIVEHLKTTRLDDDQLTAVAQLHRSGRALLGTLNDALDSAQLESGQLRVHPERFSLPALLRDVVDLFGDEARAKGVALTLDVQDGAGEVFGDALRVRQVLQNLVGNAVKFTHAGKVTVQARTAPVGPSSVELAIDVVDTGVGFDARERVRLFQRFSQLVDGRSGGGTGLGLAICADLVRLMGGEIDAASPGRGRGATFSVRIPLALHLADAADDDEIMEGRRVLVVDDNPVNLAVACGYLQALGVDVDKAASGHAALAQAATLRYDAILMDLLMPGKDGYETTRDLRARGDVTPVLALTASSDDSTDKRCRAAGMDALVEKPISSDTLRHALARVIARPTSR